jgi:hypothetical protein
MTELSLATDHTGVVAPRPDAQALRLTQGILMTPTGAVIDEDITIDEFCDGLKNCQALANSSMWTLGDLLVYGESRGEWGEMYTQALDLTQKSYSTLTQAMHISKQYPMEERNADVSWSHHREAASIKNRDERQAVLKQAAGEGWTREQVREHVKGAVPQTHNVTTCPQCGHEWS